MVDDLGLKFLKDAGEFVVAHVHVHEERALGDVLALTAAVLPERIEHEHLVPRRLICIGDM